MVCRVVGDKGGASRRKKGDREGGKVNVEVAKERGRVRLAVR